MMIRSLVVIAVVLLGISSAQTLRIFASETQQQAIQKLVDDYIAETGTAVEIELGGATTEQRTQYLSTVLTAQSGEIDVYLFDVVNPLQFAATGWLEPLNSYFESEAAMQEYLSGFLPSVVQTNLIDGTLYGIPAWTDTRFLYYRTDLLEKYGFEPPKTWEELKEQALAITEGEGNPELQGFNYQGAAIEGTNCTFLEALWTAGGDWRDADGTITVDGDAGRRALEWYQDTLDSGITVPTIAEMTTDLSRQAFQSGNAVFMMNWSYAWARFQNDEDSLVKGNVGLAPIPVFDTNAPATCVGGFQWGINPYSENKEGAFALIQYLSSEESQRYLAAQWSQAPARANLYEDADVLAAAPQFGDFYEVIVNARPRPQTEFYTDVSDLVRTSVNAFLAGSEDIDATLQDIQVGLEDIFAQ
ncbi:MAG: ABC transporter substrate-binding protein [Trueperaceae bacterium]